MSRASGMLVAIAITGVCASLRTHAEESRPLYRSSALTSMGGVGVMTDERFEAVFMNPAALAGRKGFGLHYVNVMGELSRDVYSAYGESRNFFSNPTISGVNTLMGKNIYMRAQYTPVFLMGPLALAIIVDGQNAFFAKNQAYPQITVGYQVTNGLQLAYGARLPLRSQKLEWKVGASVKYLYRRGGYNVWGPLELLQLENGMAVLTDKTGQFENGLGFDIGTQAWFKANKKFKWGFGATYLDIGDTTFGGKAAPIAQDLSLGAAAVYDAGLVSTKLEYNFRNALGAESIAKKSRLGLEIAIPLFRFYLGYAQAAPAFGVGLNLGVSRITIGTYGEELGTYSGQNPDRRFMVTSDLKFDF